LAVTVARRDSPCQDEVGEITNFTDFNRAVGEIPPTTTDSTDTHP
jgi:hypothetical protein